MLLNELHAAGHTSLAADGIPLHFGDLKAEYHAGLQAAVLMDRSHEARIEAVGQDRLALIHRISTNDLTNMEAGEGRATVFTNANARILDRAFVYNRGETALLVTEPGRGPGLLKYLQKNIFFNDDFRVRELSGTTNLLALHGPQADAVIEAWAPGIINLRDFYGTEVRVGDAAVWVARRKPVSGTHWIIIPPVELAAAIWSSLLEAGKPYGISPAGSLAYNALRIRAGRPAVGHELSLDYIPLEAGLWDEVSFSKGCYTGQEIIARLESRHRLAKIMVTLRQSAPVAPLADIYIEGRRSGTLTSSVTTPDEEHLGIGFVKVSDAQPGAEVTLGDTRTSATITALAGAPPPQEITESIAHRP